jgi:hypothetical protein
MGNLVKEIDDKIEKLRQEINDLNEEKRLIRKSCKHQWGKVEAIHDIRRGKAYGTPDFVDSWKRSCLLCGFTEETTKFNTVKTPIF